MGRGSSLPLLREAGRTGSAGGGSGAPTGTAKRKSESSEKSLNDGSPDRRSRPLALSPPCHQSPPPTTPSLGRQGVEPLCQRPKSGDRLLCLRLFGLEPRLSLPTFAASGSRAPAPIRKLKHGCSPSFAHMHRRAGRPIVAYSGHIVIHHRCRSRLVGGAEALSGCREGSIRRGTQRSIALLTHKMRTRRQRVFGDLRR